MKKIIPSKRKFKKQLDDWYETAFDTLEKMSEVPAKKPRQRKAVAQPVAPPWWAADIIVFDSPHGCWHCGSHKRAIYNPSKKLTCFKCGTDISTIPSDRAHLCGFDGDSGSQGYQQ